MEVNIYNKRLSNKELKYLHRLNSYFVYNKPGYLSTVYPEEAE